MSIPYKACNMTRSNFQESLLGIEQKDSYRNATDVW